MGSTLSSVATLPVAESIEAVDGTGASGRDLIVSEVGISVSQNCDNTRTAGTKTLFPHHDITPIHIQTQILHQQLTSFIHFPALPSMYDHYNDSSHSSSRSRPKDPERYKSHSSYRDHHTRDAAAHAVELSNLLDKCRVLESTLKARDKEIHDLRKERDRLLDDRKRMQQKLAQQEAAQATAVANALAAVARSAPAPSPKSSKYRQSTAARSHPESLGLSSSESFSTSFSNQSRRTSTTSMTSLHALPTYQDEYMAHIQSFDVFMTKTDSWSGAQVIQAVDDLNSEIHQFSEALTDLHDKLRSRRGVITPNALGQAKQNTTTRLGVHLMHLLSTGGDSDDSLTLIPLAIQASLCSIVDRTLAGFCIGFPAKYDALLNQLYLQICSSGKFFFPIVIVGARIM